MHQIVHRTVQDWTTARLRALFRQIDGVRLTAHTREAKGWKPGDAREGPLLLKARELHLVLEGDRPGMILSRAESSALPAGVADGGVAGGGAGGAAERRRIVADRVEGPPQAVAHALVMAQLGVALDAVEHLGWHAKRVFDVLEGATVQRTRYTVRVRVRGLPQHDFATTETLCGGGLRRHTWRWTPLAPSGTSRLVRAASAGSLPPIACAA